MLKRNIDREIERLIFFTLKNRIEKIEKRRARDLPHNVLS